MSLLLKVLNVATSDGNMTVIYIICMCHFCTYIKDGPVGPTLKDVINFFAFRQLSWVWQMLLGLFTQLETLRSKAERSSECDPYPQHSPAGGWAVAPRSLLLSTRLPAGVLSFTPEQREDNLTFSCFCLVAPHSFFVKRFKSKQAWNPPYSFILHQRSNDCRKVSDFSLSTLEILIDLFFLTVGPHRLKKERKKGTKEAKALFLC